MKRGREEDKEELESFYGHGQTWFRGQMIAKESSGFVYIACRLKKPKRRLVFANNIIPGLFTVKSAIADSDLLQEAMVLDDLHGCLHIRQMLGEEFTRSVKSGKLVTNLLLEYCSGGTLARLIKTDGGSGLPVAVVRQYTRDILLGLARIHEKGYVCGALKPENVLLVPNNDINASTEYIAKIGDLGLAQRVNERKEKNMGRGDLKYMAPETLVKNIQEPCSDIWALGCVVAEMLLGFPIWNGMEDSEIEEILYDVAEDQRETEITCATLLNEGKDFLMNCLVSKADRLSAGMLLNHPFVKELEEEDNTADRALETVEEALEEVNTASTALESAREALESAKQVLETAKEVLEGVEEVANNENLQEPLGLTMSEDYLPLELDEEGPVEDSEATVTSPTLSYNSDDNEDSYKIIPSFGDEEEEEEEESLHLGSVKPSKCKTFDEEANSCFCTEDRKQT